MPGLYVEDGWMSKYITSVTPATKDECVTDSADRSVTNIEESVTNTGDNVTSNDKASVTKSDETNKNANPLDNAGVEQVPNPEPESKDEDVVMVNEESETKLDKIVVENDQKISIDKR